MAEPTARASAPRARRRVRTGEDPPPAAGLPVRGDGARGDPGPRAHGPAHRGHHLAQLHQLGRCDQHLHRLQELRADLPQPDHQPGAGELADLPDLGAADPGGVAGRRPCSSTSRCSAGRCSASSSSSRWCCRPSSSACCSSTFFLPGGAVDQVLRFVGLGNYSWLGNPWSARVVVILALVWASFGFGMVVDPLGDGDGGPGALRRRGHRRRVVVAPAALDHHPDDLGVAAVPLASST